MRERLGLIALAFATALVLLPAAAASDLAGTSSPPTDPTPNAPNAVRAVYTTRILEDLRGFQVDVDLNVHELEVAPTGGHSAGELRATAGPLRDLFESAVRDAIQTEAQRVLPDAKVQLSRILFDYGAAGPSGDLYHPGIGVHATLEALFTPQFFGLPATFQTPASDVARAFLYSGGTYDLQKQVRVPAGFDVRYVLSAPSFLELDGPSGGSANLVELHADNFAGATPRAAALNFGIHLRGDSVAENVRAGPLVKAVFVVDDATPVWEQLVPFTSGRYVGNLDLRIEVNSLDASLFANYPLPPSLQLHQISGDLLRIAIRENLVARQDVTRFFQDLIERSLQEGFGDQIEVKMDWTALDQSLNQPVGGADGQTVLPVVVHATAVLPFSSNKMFVSSTLGRLVGMTLGMNGDFELANDGMWNSDYTVAYPENVHVNVKDSLHRVENQDWDTRDGFHVYLAKGESTQVQVSGRSDFDTLVFLAGVLEILLVLLALWGVARKVQSRRAHPWRI